MHGTTRLDSERSTLTPRQDRIEAAIMRQLREGAPRSVLRESVHAFADLQRQQGIAPERAVARVKAVASQGTAAIAARAPTSVGDSAADRMSMVVRWWAARYFRAD